MEAKNQAKERNCDEQKAERKPGYDNECNQLDSKGFLVTLPIPIQQPEARPEVQREE
jgi:hypothetical protein